MANSNFGLLTPNSQSIQSKTYCITLEILLLVECLNRSIMEMPKTVCSDFWFTRGYRRHIPPSHHPFPNSQHQCQLSKLERFASYGSAIVGHRYYATHLVPTRVNNVEGCTHDTLTQYKATHPIHDVHGTFLQARKRKINVRRKINKFVV